MSGPLLELKHVSKSYVSASGAPPVSVLRDVTFSVAPGESVAIIGPSGSGKSTLLNLLGTLDLPDSGEMYFEGRSVHSLSEEQLSRLRHDRLGFVFQSHHLLPHCTVIENVLVPTLAFSKRSTDAQLTRAKELLKRVGIQNRLDHLPGRLSGGERQRVAVVRALINQPGLLLADEPTGALDRMNAEGIGQLLVELNREEKLTTLVVTHSRDLALLMGRVYEMKEGRLIQL